MKKKRSRKSLSDEADRLFSLQVRARGHCELWILKPDLRCAGDHQCCHVLSRRYRSVRWSEDNAFCGCQAHHTWFTHNPHAFYLAVESAFPGLQERLWEQAQIPWDKSLAAVLDRLRASEEAI